MSSAQRAPLFSRELGPNIRLALAVCASLALMATDVRNNTLAWARSVSGLAINPIHAVITAPFLALGDALDFFSIHADLLAENRALRQQQIKLAARQLDHDRLAAENAHLRTALRLTQPPGYRFLAAEVIRIPNDPFARSLIIDRGAQMGVPLGAPVVDGNGVIGQITRVDSLSSEVTLVTSQRLSVPVQSQRSGLRLLAEGGGVDRLVEVTRVDPHADLQTGDLLVTSGLDGLYPAGLPVAKIIMIRPPQSSPFGSASAIPVAGVGETRHLLILQKMTP